MSADDKEQDVRPLESTPPRHRACDLMGGGRVAIVEHDGEDYLLRVTSRGRLVLTK